MIDPLQAILPGNVIKPIIIGINSNINLQEPIPAKQMRHRALRPKAIKHPNNNERKLKAMFGKSNRLRFIVRIHIPGPILNGHPIIHAAINPQLHYPLKRSLIRIIAVQLSHDKLSSTMGG